MKTLLAVLFLTAALATPAPTADPMPGLGGEPPCDNESTLTFDDVPSFRVGDPHRAEKQAIGMNPLQVKQIIIEATTATISLRVRTHDSFLNYWDYAKKREASGISVGSVGGEDLRGELIRFIARPKGKPDQAFDVRVWLAYSSPTAYSPRYHVTNKADASVKKKRLPGDPREAPPATAVGPINISLALNEADIRIPTQTYGFQPGDEITFHFRRGQTSVCVPEFSQ